MAFARAAGCRKRAKPSPDSLQKRAKPAELHDQNEPRDDTESRDHGSMRDDGVEVTAPAAVRPRARRIATMSPIDSAHDALDTQRPRPGVACDMTVLEPRPESLGRSRRIHAGARTGRRHSIPRSCGRGWRDSSCRLRRRSGAAPSRGTPHKNLRSSGRRCRSS